MENGGAIVKVMDAKPMLDPRAAVAARSLDDVNRLAQAIAKAGLYGVKSVDEAMIRMVTGMELGLSALQSIRGVFVISTGGKNMPGLYADVMVAICKSRPDVCEYFQLIESTGQKATYATKRRGAPSETRMTFTIEEARNAGLAGKDVWKSYGPAMLRARCSSALSRVEYPDLLNGLYSIEELQDMRASPQSIPIEARITVDGEFVAPESDGANPQHTDDLGDPPERSEADQAKTVHTLRMMIQNSRNAEDVDLAAIQLGRAKKDKWLVEEQFRELVEFGKKRRAEFTLPKQEEQTDGAQ